MRLAKKLFVATLAMLGILYLNGNPEKFYWPGIGGFMAIVYSIILGVHWFPGDSHEQATCVGQAPIPSAQSSEHERVENEVKGAR